MKVFLFNQSTGEFELNQEEILLVREFEKLINPERNKSPEDPEGRKLLRAFREFKYIWLMLDWKTPYRDYSERERHKECVLDSKLTKAEFDDPDFRAACRKYREMQDEDQSMKLVLAAKETANKFIDYFHNVDPEERDPVTHKPIYSVKNIMAEIKGINDVIDEIKKLEQKVQKDIVGEDKKLWGSNIEEFIPR